MMTEVSLQDAQEETEMCNQTRVKLEKNLASPDKAKREKAMSLLCLWLTSQKEIKEEELAKIWKGLFYCLWHAEKEVVQVDLVERMAHLMEKLDVELSLLFFKVFLTTLRNEWGGIDNYSQGRFQLLLTHYVCQMFGVLRKNEWDIEVVRKFMDALVERALLVQDGVNAGDVNVYIAGVFLHELKQYLPIPSGVFKVLLEPFWVALAKGCDERVAEEISKNVFLVLFEHGSRLLSFNQGLQHSDKEETAYFGAIALHLSFLIRTKCSALLAFASESKSIQLKVIEEKFACLERLQAQSRISCCGSNGDDANVTSAETDAESNADADNSLAKITDRMQTSISPVQYPVTRTFGRRSKRNQKLVFSPETVDNVYIMESASKLGTLPEDFPVQLENEQLSEEGGSTPLEQHRNDLVVASKSEHNLDTGDVIDVGGSPPKHDVNEDDSNVLAASQDGITMEDPVISNLAKRFESIADQSPGCAVEVSSIMSTPLGPSPVNTGLRKRKSWRSSPLNALDSESPTGAKENSAVPHDSFQGDDMTSIDNVSAKKAKKVHFSLQHNIVWRPSTPLPPHDVRVPPAATPRGSALKKGVLPGPIVDVSDVLSASPKKKKKKKKATPRKSPSAHVKSPKSLKHSTKEIKAAKKGRLSPR